MEDPEEWEFIVEGRYNLGATSLHLNMILAKSIQEAGYNIYNRTYKDEEQDEIKKIFYKNLRFYMEMIERIIVRTYDYIGEMPASVNPIMFTQGLAYGGNLKPDEKLKKILFASTSSYGYVGLEELQQLWNGKSIVDDGDFAYEVLKFMNDFKDESKERTGINTALYSTPAESLAGTQIQQFRKMFGIVKNVSDKEYFTNSFHMPVSAEITPIEKQDLEERFFKIPAGGRIQYVRIPNSNNPEGVRMLIERGIQKGYYQGVNLQKSYGECGHEFFENEYDEFNNACPICGCKDITTITRVCGYMGLQRIHGDTKLNNSKLAEVADRKSM